MNLIVIVTYDVVVERDRTHGREKSYAALTSSAVSSGAHDLLPWSKGDCTHPVQGPG